MIFVNFFNLIILSVPILNLIQSLQLLSLFSLIQIETVPEALLKFYPLTGFGNFEFIKCIVHPIFRDHSTELKYNFKYHPSIKASNC